MKPEATQDISTLRHEEGKPDVDSVFSTGVARDSAIASNRGETDTNPDRLTSSGPIGYSSFSYNPPFVDPVASVAVLSAGRWALQGNDESVGKTGDPMFHVERTINPHNVSMARTINQGVNKREERFASGGVHARRRMTIF
jgi:hypothetical protein